MKNLTRKKVLALFLSLSMLFIMISFATFAADSTTFSDVSSSDYYFLSSDILAKLDILQGYPDKTFGGNKNITRAEMATVIIRSLGQEVEANAAKGDITYIDVAATHWANGYINQATKLEIIEGDGNGKFRPGDNVKYEEAVKIVVCSIGLGEQAIEAGGWPDGYIKVAQENGILENVPGSIGLASTRGAVAQMTYQGLLSQVKVPSPSVKPGNYSSSQKITLSTETKEAKIYYTLDNSNPTIQSTEYKGEISITKSTTLKAITVKNQYLVSKTFTGQYNISTSSGGGGGNSTRYVDLNYKIQYYQDDKLLNTLSFSKKVPASAPTLTVEEVDTESYLPEGYKLESIDPELPVDVKEGDVIKVYYEPDYDVTKEISYTVEYYKDSELIEIESFAKKVWINEPTLTVEEVDTESYLPEGYKLESIDPELPVDVKEGDVIKVYYEPDYDVTKEISYTVEYYTDSEQIVAKECTGKIWINESELNVGEDDIVHLVGYKLISTDPELPVAVKEGDVIKVYYEPDYDVTKEISYTVEYYKDGELFETKSFAKEVWINEPTLTVEEVDTETYLPDDYQLLSVTPRLPAGIKDGDVIRVYYTQDTNELTVKAYEYFCRISEIPRGSDNEQAISDYLVSFAEENGLEVIQDEFRNILIKKPGSVGREDEPPVILQGHMDMVCVKDSDVDHDFLKDPIIPIIDGDWIKANGTSLGADNGCGVAMIMALLAATDLSHPPIEAIMTANEEGGYGPGAFEFDTSLLQGKRFINLDSEEEGVLTASCADGAWSDVIITLENETAPSGINSYELMITGLLGGHSGIDIEKGRANAIILMAHLLKALDEEDIYLTNIEGGEFVNEITRECTALISFAESDLDKINSLIGEMESKFKEDFPVDDGLKIILEKTDTCEYVMSHDSLQNIIDCILETPNGVQSMSSTLEGLVQTSNNTGVIFTLRDSEFFPSDVVVMSNLLRSSVEEEMMDMLTKIAQLGEKPGVIVDSPLDYPDWIFMPWTYREDSPLRDKMITIFENIYGYTPTVEGTHGILECAVFATKMPDSDFISMGPTVKDVHSTRERMSLSSFNRTCIYLIEILENL